jgi:arginyl-tRNA--protein-N-Asp/Glu arginylyltransferase
MPMFIRQATLTHVACSLGGWKTTASTDATVLIPDGPQMLLSQGWDVGCQTATLNCCRGCEACRPVRIDVSIPPSRRERRAIAIPKKVAWTQPQALDDEHLALLKRHRVARLGIHDLPDPVKILQPGTPGGWTSVLDLRNENGTLLAFIVIAMYPRGVAFARIHAFDPTAGGSLGTAIIAIAVSGLARGRIGTTHLYLGNTSAAEWNYKAKFAGSEILGRTGWVRAGADVDKLHIPPPATKDEIDGKTEKKT